MSSDALRIESPGKRVPLLGNEAIARGAIEAGVSVVSCYPGTPSSEISDALASLSKEFDFYMEYSANEKVALEVAAGAAMAGGKGLAIMKHVGLNVASDAFFTLAYTGVSGSLVIVVCDDPFMYSSQTEQDTRLIARAAHVPLLDPSDPNEARKMIKEAFNISERFGTPVMLRPTTRVCHTTTLIEPGELPKGRKTKLHWDSKRDWYQQYASVPAISRNNRLKLIHRTAEIAKLFEEIGFNELRGQASETGILTSGISYNYVCEAIEIMGLRASILKIGTSFPLPKRKMGKFLETIKRLIVVEEGEPYLEEYVKSIALDANPSVKVYGKENGFLPEPYDYDVPTVIKGISKACGVKPPMDYEDLERRAAAAKKLAPNRPPTFCAGCPHTATFYALRRATKGKAALSGDIGCYGLGFLPPFKGIDSIICMGASLGIASGLQYVIEEPVVAIIGDSTFFHAGLSPLASAIYNRANFTLLILDNSATAMTGFQPNPSTKKHESDDSVAPISIEAVVKGMGAEFVRIVNPFQLDATIETLKAAISFRGVSVVISRQLCVFIMMRNLKMAGKRPESYRIDTELCDGCFLCTKRLGCPAIIQQDKAAQILSETCVGCGVCSQICPGHAIVKAEDR